MRPCTVTAAGWHRRFQSTHSLRSATLRVYRLAGNEEFQSTHSLRSATGFSCRTDCIPQVSIHALLAECDLIMESRVQGIAGFNPRTPCGVRRSMCQGVTVSKGFQSTHSLRSATVADAVIQEFLTGFNPRTPCGVRLVRAVVSAPTLSFNPRTPCGVRHYGIRHYRVKREFQSTHSLRSATPSTHVLHT